MDLDVVRAKVGPDRFDAACAIAWQTAQGTGSGPVRDWPADLADVPHEIDDLWLDESTPAADRLTLCAAVYRAMPCYWNTVGWRWLHPALAPPGRQELWRQLRGLLEDPDPRPADPVAYALWCDWFEDADTVAEAWAQVTMPPLGRARLERVLGVSGPVPYPLKRSLLWSLVADPQWHAALRGALAAAEHDVLGAVDVADARRLRDALS